MLLFGRQYVLQVEDLEVRGLRCAFTVEKTLKKEPNKLDLKICNLNDESRQRLTKKNVSVILQAGYDSGISRIFLGAVSPVLHTKEGVDWVTHIGGGDGKKELRTARFNSSFSPNVKMKDVIDKMLDQFGFKGMKVDKAKDRIKRGDFRGAIEEMSQGFTFGGPLQDEYDRMMRSAGLTWSVQDGEMQVLTETETNKGTAISVDESSGLIGSPEFGSDGVIKFKMLMQGNVKPGDPVVVRYSKKSATVKVERVVFNGDTHSTDTWFVACEGKSTSSYRTADGSERSLA